MDKKYDYLKYTPTLPGKIAIGIATPSAIIGIIAVFFHKLPGCFSCIFPGFCGFCPKPLHKIQRCSRMMLSEKLALQEGSLQRGAVRRLLI